MSHEDQHGETVVTPIDPPKEKASGAGPGNAMKGRRGSVVSPSAPHEEEVVAAAGSGACGKAREKEARKLFGACESGGKVTRADVLRIGRDVYESHGVRFDADSASCWIDHTLVAAGTDPVDAVFDFSSFLVLYECFVVFASNMRRVKEAKGGGGDAGGGGQGVLFAAPDQQEEANTCHAPTNCHVFLGGSCDPTTWRKDLAMPALEAAGVSFYNPQVDDWMPELIQLEAKAKDQCHCLLFVIDGITRSIASMLEAVEYIVRGRRVLLVVMPIQDGALVDGEPVAGRQLKDLNRARAFLADIAERHPMCATLYDSVGEAIEACVGLSRTCQSCSAKRRFSKPAVAPIRGASHAGITGTAEDAPNTTAANAPAANDDFDVVTLEA